MNARTLGPFQSALESGLRALAVLVKAYPVKIDLQRLIYFDYLLVHSADAGGPESLHASTPLRNGELLVRRDLVERGLILFESRSLVEKVYDESGVAYLATDSASAFLDGLSSPYTLKLNNRASWAFEKFGLKSESEVAQFFEQNFSRWSSEFQAIYPASSDVLQ